MKCSLLTLSCYLDGELEARRSGEMEAHLVACPRCRAGLSHLREEIDRVSSLARVTVPESSVQALFEQLGLVAAGETAPQGPEERASLSAEAGPAWFEARPSPALPWTPPPRSARRAVATPPPRGPAIELAGLLSPRVAPPPTPSAHPDEAPEVTPGPAPATEAAAAADAGEAAAVPRSAPTGRGARALPSPPPDRAEPPAAADAVAPAWRQPARSQRTPPPDAADRPPPGPSRPLAWTPPTAAVASEIDAVTHVPAPPAAGGPPVAVWTTDPLPETAPPLYPLPLGDADTPAGPIAAPRPRLFERLRDRLALRRAIGGSPHGDDEDEVEVISGTGAPVRARGRTDLARRRSEALRPTAMPSLEAAARVESTPPRLREMLPPPARPSGSGLATPVARPAPPPRPSAHPSELPPPLAPWRVGDDDEPAGRFRVGAPPAGTARVEPAPSDLRDGRRLLALYAVAAAVLFIVGIFSGRSTSPIPGNAPASSAPERPGVAAIATTPPQSAAPVVPPAATAPPQAQATTLGSGGTGWQVQAFRYGAHAGFYRIVMDLTPAAAGAAPGPSPTVTVTQPDATTVLVTLDGTQPAASTGTLSSTATISAVTLVPAASQGATQYRITLTHGGAVHAFFTTGPLRLILDLT